MPDRDLALARETLGAAEYLVAGGYYNDAVNRAYYAMFYSARALLARRNIHPRGHKGLILQFGLEFVKTGYIEDIYGRMLSHAKERRETADYNIESKITAGEAESIVDDARNFIWRIDKAFNEMRA